jgi:anti-sigma B factor antagonist
MNEVEVGSRDEPSDGVVTVFVRGEIDLATAPGLERDLRAADRDGVREMVVDLGSVTFMDSTGIYLLLDARERAARRGCRIRLRDVPAQTRRLLEMAGSIDGYDSSVAVVELAAG